MSEAALGQPASQSGRLAPPARRKYRLNSLEALERGFALFRSTFASDAWRYYVGTAPFVLCFIPMWVVNGQIRLSDDILLLEAAILACAYLLRVWMVARYMQRVRERAFGTPSSKPATATEQAASIGRLVAWKMILSVARWLRFRPSLEQRGSIARLNSAALREEKKVLSANPLAAACRWQISGSQMDCFFS